MFFEKNYKHPLLLKKESRLSEILGNGRILVKLSNSERIYEKWKGKVGSSLANKVEQR